VAVTVAALSLGPMGVVATTPTGRYGDASLGGGVDSAAGNDFPNLALRARPVTPCGGVGVGRCE